MTRRVIAFAWAAPLCLVVAACGTASNPPVAASQGAASTAFAAAKARGGASVVNRNGVFERTFTWRDRGISNPWEQVQLTMRLTSPSGQHFAIDGFYYGGSTWKARFAPARLGHWSWRARITDGRRTRSFRGTFEVVRGSNLGFVRRSPYNQFRWVYSNGTPYYPLGIEDCELQLRGSNSPIAQWGLDGGFRPPGSNAGTLVSMQAYLRAYSSAGVNLFRWSVDNCSFPLYQTIDPSGNVYLAQNGIWGDQLVQRLRQYGFRVYMTLFNRPPFLTNPTPDQFAAMERYMKYVVDRYGAYVDFWELTNEANATDSWTEQMGGYLRQIDPYHHPISTSFPAPQLPVIDINSPHWYETESEFVSDSDTWQRMAGWRQAGKPVIVGEQGNAGRSWDPTSALRMRLRAWTAFFAEGSLIFWNGSFAKDDVGLLIYLGPQERGYMRVLQRFTSGFDPRATIAGLQTSNPASVRGYALRGPSEYAAYLIAYTNHSTPTTGITVTINPRRRGWAVWTSPATGFVLGRRRVRGGVQTLAVPAFTTDVALKVGPSRS